MQRRAQPLAVIDLLHPCDYIRHHNQIVQRRAIGNMAAIRYDAVTISWGKRRSSPPLDHDSITSRSPCGPKRLLSKAARRGWMKNHSEKAVLVVRYCGRTRPPQQTAVWAGSERSLIHQGFPCASVFRSFPGKIVSGEVCRRCLGLLLLHTGIFY